MRFYRQILLLYTTIISIACIAQEKDLGRIGTVHGILRDSVHNYNLVSATIAVYRQLDSNLVNYQLTNSFGEFRLNNLPIGIPLKVIASYTGYKGIEKKFIISKDEKSIDLKTINLEAREDGLENVIVTSIAPVRMNGDTLEFNADAFRLDKTAVTEDLLKKLPGITIWGDGTITVNGKIVSEVLVNGKPFFGGTTKIATQNLPKDIVNKVQVYQQYNMDNPLDSITKINIKLKSNTNRGYFGKVSVGYATDNHYQGDANLSFFSTQTQIGIFGSGNNVNKITNSIDTLMRNNTFKNIENSSEYQSNFDIKGINQSKSGGFIFQHDFIPDPDYYKNNRLNGNYYLNNNITKILTGTRTHTSIGNDSTLTQENNNNVKSSNTRQTFNANYNKHRNNNFLDVFMAMAAINNNSNNSEQTATFNTAEKLINTNDVQNVSNNNSKEISIATKYNHMKDPFSRKNGPGNWNIAYSLNIENNGSDKTNKTNFISLIDSNQNRYFNRQYQNQLDIIQQDLYFKFGNFSPILFGKITKLSKFFQVDFENNLNLSIQNQHNLVNDKDTNTDKPVINDYLTNNNTYTVINEIPGLNFSRSYNKILAYRYHKILNINFLAQMQFYIQKNISENVFQSFTRDYQRFVPKIILNFNNHHFGSYQDLYTLAFGMASDYPDVDQLFPLVDSSNLFNIREGNARLIPNNKKQLSFSFRHDSYHAKNTFNYNFIAIAGISNNYFADSTIIDQLGRYTYYNVNLNGHRHLDASAEVNKAFKFKNNRLQISWNTSLKFARNPSYLKSPNQTETISNISNTIHSSTRLRIYYTINDVLDLNVSQALSHFLSKQSGFSNNGFSYKINSTKLDASINFTKKFIFNSNITYNRTVSTGSSTINFKIWNANVSYRFTKANNIALQLSALDILHENKGVINYGNNYSLTYGTANVLQQYFMLSLSYFPRKFGK